MPELQLKSNINRILKKAADLQNKESPMESFDQLLASLNNGSGREKKLEPPEQKLASSLLWRIGQAYLGAQFIGPKEWAIIPNNQADDDGSAPILHFLEDTYLQPCIVHSHNCIEVEVRSTHAAFLGSSAVNGSPLTISCWRKLFPYVPGQTREHGSLNRPHFCCSNDLAWYGELAFASRETPEDRWYLLMHKPPLLQFNCKKMPSAKAIAGQILRTLQIGQRKKAHQKYRLVPAVVYLSHMLMTYVAVKTYLNYRLPVICLGNNEESELVSVELGEQGMIFINNQLDPGRKHGVALERI